MKSVLISDNTVVSGNKVSYVTSNTSVVVLLWGKHTTGPTHNTTVLAPLTAAQDASHLARFAERQKDALAATYWSPDSQTDPQSDRHRRQASYMVEDLRGTSPTRTH